jgi:DNA-binding transcriptional LysR family regulator
MMFGITLHQMQCFDALVSLGSFQAAAEKVRRSQPSVSASVKNLEAQLGLQLLDRTGYRVVLTPAGQSFHARVRSFLHDFHTLENYAAQLAMGAESALTIVVGDVSPLPETLSLLKDFFEQVPETQLNLHFEAISGPCERLFNEAADLILHHIDKTDPRLEFIPLLRVDLIPVVAPNFLRFPISNSITPEQMRDYAQCVIRDTPRRSREWTQVCSN